MEPFKYGSLYENGMKKVQSTRREDKGAYKGEHLKETMLTK